MATPKINITPFNAILHKYKSPCNASATVKNLPISPSISALLVKSQNAIPNIASTNLPSLLLDNPSYIHKGTKKKDPKTPKFEHKIEKLSDPFKSKHPKLLESYQFGITEKTFENAKLESPDLIKYILSLELGNDAQIVQANKAIALEEFSRTGKHDTGSVEVQAAALSVRITRLMEHLLTHRKEHSGKRLLTELMDKRAKLLKYLKRLSLSRYFHLVHRLGLDVNQVESNLINEKYTILNKSVTPQTRAVKQQTSLLKKQRRTIKLKMKAMMNQRK